MNSYVKALLGLGNAGAVANARRACDERVATEARLDVQLRRLAATAPTARTVEAAARRSA